ncbi:hypothetical protein IPM62_03115 [Candidatus Woesebacteria bacterium]|nr:MAG: hypothetical protein IPM62_03115 [Candidatus Woesebacteria bacterium]
MPKNTKLTPTKSEASPNTTVARSDDGTVQITFTIPESVITAKRKTVLEEISKDVEVPGFRKGKAPLDKVEAHVSSDTLIQRTLSQILPKLLGDAIKSENLRPALYPKFELLKSNPNEPWEVRAVTCELPQVDLGDYKSKISGALKASSIWTPDKGGPKDKDSKPKEVSRQEKEMNVIKVLLDTIKLNLPKLLIDEEVNNKLSQLLSRIEKLGLSLDNYLASLGKTPIELRNEYEIQAKDAISLDLILTQIAISEKVEVTEAEIQKALEAAMADPSFSKNEDNGQQKRVIESILQRRKVLDRLIDLM